MGGGVSVGVPAGPPAPAPSLPPPRRTLPGALASRSRIWEMMASATKSLTWGGGERDGRRVGARAEGGGVATARHPPLLPTPRTSPPRKMMRWSSSREKGSPPMSAELAVGWRGVGGGGGGAARRGGRAPPRRAMASRRRHPSLPLLPHRGASSGWRDARPATVAARAARRGAGGAPRRPAARPAARGRVLAARHCMAWAREWGERCRRRLRRARPQPPAALPVPAH